ncbi:hypothetical protein [Qipengyuania sp. ASV99]|uniref:hypothetical protein n=1 Tax=Qipengyuania sp. ASV99 TaxID=3399681 RepID=UPI003A4C7D0E
MIHRLSRLAVHLFALIALMWSGAAMAEVQIHFHSFNGSVLLGRYPHTFIVLDGTLSSGQVVNENYGFSARRATTEVLSGPVEHMVLAESERNVRRTNRHFSLTISDAQYRRIIAEVQRWQNAPGKYYDLETRNCIHFVGEMARILGLRVEYPGDMLRRPKKWLNHITALNPQLGARAID